MSMPALQTLEKKIERQIRLFGLRRGAIERKIEKHIETHKKKIEIRLEAHRKRFEDKIESHKRKLEDKIEGHKKKFEQKLESRKQQFQNHRKRIGSKIERQLRRFEEKNGIRIDDEVRFFRTWIEKPLTMGSVTPSGRALARTMAAYVDPSIPGPIIELGPGTGPVTDALVAQGVDPARLVLVEFDPTFCRILQGRYPTATVVQGDAYSLRRVLQHLLREPAAAVVSGLPLFTKPLTTRLRLLFD